MLDSFFVRPTKRFLLYWNATLLIICVFQPQTMRSNMVPNTMSYAQSMGAPLGSANYGSASMYSIPSTAPHMQPAPARVCNVSNEAQIISNSPITAANIVFRKLPFFKLKHQILKPTVLSQFIRNYCTLFFTKCRKSSFHFCCFRS